MDPCVLAETGLNTLHYGVIALTLFTLSLVVFKKLSYKPFIAAIAFIFSLNLLVPYVVSAQSLPEECLLSDPDNEIISLSLLDDAGVMQLPDGDTFFSTNIYLPILSNDIPPTQDPLDWSTIDLDLNTLGQQTSFSLPHPNDDTYSCGEVSIGSFGILVVELRYECWDEDQLNSLIIPNDFSIPPFNYTVQTLSGLHAPDPAIVTVSVEATPDIGEVIAVDDFIYNCAYPVQVSILLNDSTSVGALNTSTVDLNPSLPGQQTSVSIEQNGEVFTAEVNSSGVVTFNSSSGMNCPPDFFYTVRNSNGTLSNVALIRLDLGST